ncbi:Uncharacterized protein SCF082_LOCUS14921 [Durusdinium trenchii]|uniref:BZIP domain-containing protein n=1 Tax=Durusdinium trenchii TaxID=1381693 RepID=A0ABP0K125_9DINO
MGKDRRKSRSRSRSRRRNGEEDEEDLSPEARIELLEVENETLKAENRELRKKLVETLRKGGAGRAFFERRSGLGEPVDRGIVLQWIFDFWGRLKYSLNLFVSRIEETTGARNRRRRRGKEWRGKW